MEISDIIDKLKELENEIRDLKRDKAQAEAFCAAVVRKYNGEVILNHKDIFNADYERVRLIPIDETESSVKIVYIEDVEVETKK